MTKPKNWFVTTLQIYEKIKTEISTWHKYSYPLPGHLKFSSEESVLHVENCGLFHNSQVHKYDLESHIPLN